MIAPTDRPLPILFAASEAQPLIKTGGLADVALALPRAQAQKGVDVRVVITSLMDKLQERPYHLQEGVHREVGKLDTNLRQRVEAHAFVWDTIWEPAYPADEYWYLYVCPKGGTEG